MPLSKKALFSFAILIAAFLGLSGCKQELAKKSSLPSSPKLIFKQEGIFNNFLVRGEKNPAKAVDFFARAIYNKDLTRERTLDFKSIVLEGDEERVVVISSHCLNTKSDGVRIRSLATVLEPVKNGWYFQRLPKKLTPEENLSDRKINIKLIRQVSALTQKVRKDFPAPCDNSPIELTEKGWQGETTKDSKLLDKIKKFRKKIEKRDTVKNHSKKVGLIEKNIQKIREMIIKRIENIKTLKQKRIEKEDSSKDSSSKKEASLMEKIQEIIKKLKEGLESQDQKSPSNLVTISTYR